MTSRRELLALLLALPTLRAMQQRRVYGYVDVHLAQAQGWWPATVLLDGVDVSNDCRALDDRAGWVELHERDAAGHRFRRGGAIATLQRTGHVVLIPKGYAR